MGQDEEIQQQIETIRAQVELLHRQARGAERTRWSRAALNDLRTVLEVLREREATEGEEGAGRERIGPLPGPVVPLPSRSPAAELDVVLRHLPLGVILAEAPSGRMLTYNRAAEEIFRFPPPLADGTAEYSSLYQGYRADGTPYGADEWPMSRALRGEVVMDEEILFLRPDGGRMICRVSAAPVRDGAGRITAGVITFADVTERRLAEERQALLAEAGEVLSASLDYRATVQRLAELLVRELGDYAVVHAQEEGALEAVGIAHGHGAAPDALRRVLRYLPPDPPPEHPIQRVCRTGEPLLIPQVSEEMLRLAAPHAEQLELLRGLELGSAVIVPLRAGGRVLGAITLARRRGAPPVGQAELALATQIGTRAAHAVDNARLYRGAEAAARARDDILSVVSHDLRNALNAALMNTDLLLDIAPVFPTDSRERRQLETVRRSLDHMHRLVQDLLEVDRLERGRLSVHPSRLLPGALVEDLMQTFGPLARDAGVRLETEIPATTPAVLADAARVMQVFSNLVSNAVQHTEPGGAVSVTVEPLPSAVRFLVRDTGKGIPADDLPRIFDRFFQSGPARPSSTGSGSGLGLTIARGIVEAHGGRIGVESRVGEGSTFWFTLPRTA